MIRENKNSEKLESLTPSGLVNANGIIILI